MEDNARNIESLLESTTEYVKTSIELAKLKIFDKVADVVSALIPHTALFAVIICLLLFLSLGCAFWLGGILNEIYLGFFVVAGFYGLLALVLHFFMNKRFKNLISDYVVKQLLK